MPQQPIWISFEDWADTFVDQWFAEPVQLVPWTGGTVTSEGGPDPARQAVTTEAVFVTPGAHSIGEGGLAHSGSANIQLLEADTWCSIQQVRLGTGLWRAFDRIYFSNRNAWYSIVFVSPSATYRPNIHLVRLNASSLQSKFWLAGKPAGKPASKAAAAAAANAWRATHIRVGELLKQYLAESRKFARA